jgi:hypothetical protein
LSEWCWYTEFAKVAAIDEDESIAKVAADVAPDTDAEPWGDDPEMGIEEEGEEEEVEVEDEAATCVCKLCDILTTMGEDTLFILIGT